MFSRIPYNFHGTGIAGVRILLPDTVAGSLKIPASVAAPFSQTDCLLGRLLKLSSCYGVYLGDKPF